MFIPAGQASLETTLGVPCSLGLESHTSKCIHVIMPGLQKYLLLQNKLTLSGEKREIFWATGLSKRPGSIRVCPFPGVSKQCRERHRAKLLVRQRLCAVSEVLQPTTSILVHGLNSKDLLIDPLK